MGRRNLVKNQIIEKRIRGINNVAKIGYDKRI
jgi:hypothetical protein